MMEMFSSIILINIIIIVVGVIIIVVSKETINELFCS